MEDIYKSVRSKNVYNSNDDIVFSSSRRLDDNYYSESKYRYDYDNHNNLIAEYEMWDKDVNKSFGKKVLEN